MAMDLIFYTLIAGEFAFTFIVTDINNEIMMKLKANSPAMQIDPYWGRNDKKDGNIQYFI